MAHPTFLSRQYKMMQSCRFARKDYFSQSWVCMRPRNFFVRPFSLRSGLRYVPQNIDRSSAEIRRPKPVGAHSTSSWNTGWILFIIGTSLGIAAKTTMSSPSRPETDSTLALSKTVTPDHNISKLNMRNARDELVLIVGEEHVTSDESTIEHHSGSIWSSYHFKNDKPLSLVVFPSSTVEVGDIMKVCHQRHIPVTPFSGGTSLEGHYASTRGGICIDFTRMDKVLKLHDEDLDVVVQPGVRWEDLNAVLAQKGLFFPPDPGPGAMIGGMVGTGCSGTNAYRYGTMKEWVLSLTVVLADGTIIKTRQRPRKSSAGYDLTRMFVGSEGTLGLVTEATLKVINKPEIESVVVASFPTIKAAANCAADVVRKGIPVAAVEILDEALMRCLNESGATSTTWKESPTLFFKFAGATEAGVQDQIGMVREIASHNDLLNFQSAKSSAEAKELWSARKQALWSVMALAKDETDSVWSTDVAVPISQLPVIIEETQQDIIDSGVIGAIVGHVGDGNFHATLVFPKSQTSIVEGIVKRLNYRAIELEGTVTGEHGVGLVKRDYLKSELGESTVDAMRQLKRAFDPLCLLNCDKVVRMEQGK